MKRSLVLLILILIPVLVLAQNGQFKYAEPEPAPNPTAVAVTHTNSLSAEVSSEMAEAFKEIQEALKEAQEELREALAEARQELDEALGEAGKSIEFYLSDEEKAKLDNAKQELSKMQELLKDQQKSLQEKIKDIVKDKPGKVTSSRMIAGPGMMSYSSGMYGPGMGMGMGMGMDPFYTGEPVDQSDWVIKFYTFDKSMEPYMPLLKNILPHTSTFTFSDDLYSVAIFTSPEGQEKADDFINQLLKVKEEAQKRKEEEKNALTAREKIAAASVQHQLQQDSNMREQKSSVKGNVLLEILILQGMPAINTGDPITISQDAKDMGMAPEDFRFLGSKRWQTYGKGIVSTSLNSDTFSTDISDCSIKGRLIATDKNSIDIELDAQIMIVEKFKDDSGRFTSRTARIGSKTEFEIGQTTLLGTTSISNSDVFLLVIRANKTDSPNQKLHYLK